MDVDKLLAEYPHIDASLVASIAAQAVSISEARTFLTSFASSPPPSSSASTPPSLLSSPASSPRSHLPTAHPIQARAPSSLPVAPCLSSPPSASPSPPPSSPSPPAAPTAPLPAAGSSRSTIESVGEQERPFFTRTQRENLAGRLTDRQRLDFYRDGYIVLRGMVSSRVCLDAIQYINLEPSEQTVADRMIKYAQSQGGGGAGQIKQPVIKSGANLMALYSKTRVRALAQALVTGPMPPLLSAPASPVPPPSAQPAQARPSETQHPPQTSSWLGSLFDRATTLGTWAQDKAVETGEAAKAAAKQRSKQREQAKARATYESLREPWACQVAAMPGKASGEGNAHVGFLRSALAGIASAATRHLNLVNRLNLWHIDGVNIAEHNVRAPRTFNFTLLCGIYLNDTTALGDWCGNFCVLAGSHHAIERLAQKEGTKLIAEVGLPASKLTNLAPPKQMHMREGDVMLAHYQLAHTVAPNLSAQTRHACYFRLSHKEHAPWTFRHESMKDIWLEFPGLWPLVQQETGHPYPIRQVVD